MKSEEEADQCRRYSLARFSWLIPFSLFKFSSAGRSSFLISSSIVLLLLYAAVETTASASGKGDFHLGWIPMRSECQGMIWQCIGRHEFDLASESGRRILATSDYISYDALKRGSVPCSRRGASYYNCRPGAQANPYSRGCSAITQCRS